MANTKVTSSLIADNAIGIDQLNVSDGTNGQALVTDGAGTLSFSTIQGYTDSDVETYLNTSEIYTDPTNNYLGVGAGASTPSHVFHVQKSVASGTLVKLQNASNTASDVLLLNTAGTGSGTNILDVQASGSSKFLVRGDGNVGINETNPAVPLHITRDSASGENIAFILDNNNTTAGNEIGMLFRSMAGSTNTDFEIFGVANAGNDMDLVFQSDGSQERVRFTGDGKVGIGTSSPSYKLEVAGDASFLGQDVLIDSQSGYKELRHTQTGENFAISTPESLYLIIDSNNDQADRSIIFAHNNTAPGSATELMRIGADGNVGIGTSSPNANAKLDVNGVIRLYNASSNPTAVAGGIYYNTTDAQVKVSNGTTWAAVGSAALPTAISNLYSWWDFSGVYSTIGSGNSTVTDASGNGYTLTETGTVTTESFPSGRSGMRTGASGAANYFTSSAIPASGGAARTLFAIFYNLKNTSEPYQHIMHYGTTSGGQAFGIAYTSGGTINQHTWAGTGASISYTQGRTGSTGVAVVFSVYDGNNTGKIRLYDAGSTTGSNVTATYSPNTGTANGIYVGGRITGSEEGDIVIGECGSYSKALTDSEMDTIAVGLLNRWT